MALNHISGISFRNAAEAKLALASHDLLAALVNLVEAIEGNRVTVGDLNEARAAIAQASN